MNLNAYDNVNDSATLKTWIDPYYRKLYSREMKFYPYFTMLKRYNDKIKTDEFYLCLSNETDDGHDWRSTSHYNNSIKVSLSEFWANSRLKDIHTKTYIIIDKDYEDSNSVVYRLFI